MFDRRPRLIVQPDCASEVAAAIAFAREYDLPLSVKGGGHGVAGRAVCDDGLVVDLSRMGAVRVDPVAGVATVQGGAALRALDAASTLLIATGWTDPRETEARAAWARETWSAAQPYAKPSAYVNYLDQGDEHRTEAVYGPNFRRLVEVKRRYDPENVFRYNANIRP